MLQPFFLIYFLFLVQNNHLFISCAETDTLGSFEICFTFISRAFDLDERKYLDMWVTGTERPFPDNMEKPFPDNMLSGKVTLCCRRSFLKRALFFGDKVLYLITFPDNMLSGKVITEKIK